MTEPVQITESSPLTVEVTEASPLTVVVEESSGDVVTIELSPTIETIEVSIPGPAGPVGPQGPIGTDLYYLHEQLVADSIWTVIHGLGKFPATTVMDTSGKVMSPQIEHVSTVELRARFFSAGQPIVVSGTMSCN